MTRSHCSATCARVPVCVLAHTPKLYACCTIARARAAWHPRGLSLSRAHALCRRSHRTHSVRRARVARPLGHAPICVLAHAGFTLERRLSAMCRLPDSCAQAARLLRALRHQRVLAPSPPATALGLFASLPSHALCPLISSVSVTVVSPGLHHHPAFKYHCGPPKF
jgi:hypothetical protein